MRDVDERVPGSYYEWDEMDTFSKIITIAFLVWGAWVLVEVFLNIVG